ncbi:MAG: ATP-binding protein [Methylobacteriaceae bacterium]|jgi:predicted AAA+ superfamily ATPase|nr:ATP-binding protein [Methylobacteriaceae bacterium]
MSPKYITRLAEADVDYSLKHFPVTAITGPRQCGKSTLAKHLAARHNRFVFLDLEKPEDLNKLTDPYLFFSTVQADLFCIDEIQRKPELFPVLRTLVDEWSRPGCFLVLGSASRDMLKQSSESLAGRIAYVRLSPFTLTEAAHTNAFTLAAYIERGGFPRSFLAAEARASFLWRQNFITTFLERDLPQWSAVPPPAMRRLWQMLAHINGQTVNYSELANSLAVSGATVKTHIDLLAGTYMLDLVPPWFSNMGKRLVKAPKVYITDSGITACLLGLRGFEEFIAHPRIGAAWEQIVLTNLRTHFPDAEFYHYRTSAGAEMDFVMRQGPRLFAVECKFSRDPKPGRGAHNAIEDIRPEHTFIAVPTATGWPLTPDISVVSLEDLTTRLQERLAK